MRNYWLRIFLGAFAIFAVGMVGVTLFRRGVTKVNEVVAGSGPLTIPLPFVPFELDGNRLGSLERLVVNREAPKKVSSLELQVKLDDSLTAQGLAGCRLAANLESDSSRKGDVDLHVGRNGRKAFFFCATQDSALVPFGTVVLQPGHVNVPLLVPESLAEQLRNGEWGDASDSTDAIAARAESLADLAEQRADSIAEVQDSLQEVRAKALEIAHNKLADSLRAEGKRRADSLRGALRHLEDSLNRQ